MFHNLFQTANPDVADAVKDADILVFVVPHQVREFGSSFCQ